MACFVAPLAEAIVTTAVTKAVKSKETESTEHINFSQKLGWLNKMLWGGSALVAFEHVWHGEVIAAFPFLTAIKDGQVAGMMHEILTTGIMMAVLVTCVWAGMVAVSSVLEKKAAKVTAEAKL